jgi:seryl-tRNA synthetase
LTKNDQGTLSEWILSDSRGILTRGAKVQEEGANIDSFSFSGSKIAIEIRSGRAVRAHDAIARIRKGLTVGPCKKLALGLRSIDVAKYEIELLGNDLPIVELPFVNEVTKTKDGILISLNVTEKEVEEQTVDRILRLYAEKAEKTKLSASREINREIWYSGSRPIPCGLDPGPDLEKKGWIKRFAPGIWFYMPPFAHLVRAVERIIVEQVAKRNDFFEVFLPKLITNEVMLKKGQLTGIPHEMFYVCEPISRDASAFEQYTDRVKVTGNIDESQLRELVRPPSYALPYAQCEPFYEIFAGEIVDIENTPIRLFDKSGFSFRYEAGGLQSIERLTAFTRIEMAFIGTPEQVCRIRDSLVESYEALLAEVLQLETRVVEVTPVWMAHAGLHDNEHREIPATYCPPVTPSLSNSSDSTRSISKPSTSTCSKTGSATGAYSPISRLSSTDCGIRK